jgi:hypothetical protein
LHGCVPFFRGGEDDAGLGTGAGPSGFPVYCCRVAAQ